MLMWVSPWLRFRLYSITKSRRLAHSQSVCGGKHEKTTISPWISHCGGERRKAQKYRRYQSAAGASSSRPSGASTQPPFLILTVAMGMDSRVLTLRGLEMTVADEGQITATRHCCASAGRNGGDFATRDLAQRRLKAFNSATYFVLAFCRLQRTFHLAGRFDAGLGRRWVGWCGKVGLVPFCC